MTEFTCTATAVAKVLGDVKSVVKPRQTMAILSHVLIDARDGIVTVTATDLDMQVKRTFPAEITEAGTFTVEAGRFTGILASMESGAQARLACDGPFVTVVCGRSRFKFPALKADGFPPLPFESAIATIEANADFMAALAGAKHAQSPNDIARRYMAGVFIGNRDGLELAATDADRLSVQRPGITAAEWPDITIPRDAVDELLKLAPGFSLEVSADKIRCIWSDGELIAKLLDTQFPNYARVIPPSGSVAKLDGDDLSTALNRIALLSGDKERTVSLSFEADKLTIRNKMRESKGEEGVEEIPCAFDAEPMELNFRSQFLRDSIAALDADEIEMTLTGPQSPAKITSAARPAMTLVCMPIRG